MSFTLNGEAITLGGVPVTFGDAAPPAAALQPTIAVGWADTSLTINGEPITLSGEIVTFGVPKAVFDARLALFFVAEIEAYNPTTQAVDVLRVSDLGYRTGGNDPGGVVTYPARLDTAFEIDRKVSLDPGQPSSRSDGNLRLLNLGRAFDAFAVPRNNDSRAVRVLVGQKSYDPNRGIFLDPPYATLRPFFAGFTASWLLAEDVLTIPVKDTSYWTSRPLQTRTYGGTGGLDGNSAMVGKYLPITRGGTAELPVQEVAPLLLDPVALVYQYTDGPGTVVALYEGGAAVFSYAGDVADLFVGQTAPGAYRTCNIKGAFQLGSPPVGSITADVTGAFPLAGPITTAAAMALTLLAETLGLPAAYADAAAFNVLDALRPYPVGFFVSDGSTTGLATVQAALASAGARLSSTRAGLLQPFVIAATLYAAQPVRTITLADAVSVTPISLPATLDPPPFRWQVAWGHNWTTQTSGLNGQVAADPVRKQDLATADRYAMWTAASVSAEFLRPNDPPAVSTMLLRGDHAQAVADECGALWQYRPGYFSVEVPLVIAAGLDIGSIVRLVWPLGQLVGGALCQIVGEQVRSYDGTTTFQVLVSFQAPDFSADDFGSDLQGGT